MNILVLYDIHGNIEALDAVLGDPRAADPDVVIVGGDVVPGPFARRTLTRLEALAPAVRWLRGNGEREVAEVAAGRPVSDEVFAQIAPASAAELGQQRSQALGELPLTVQLDAILFCHASPRRDDEMLTRLSPSERWSAALAGVDARLVVGGHTHQQDDRTVDDVRFINAGSVGLPYEGDDGAARWLWIADGTPELRRTDYDAVGAGRRMLEAGWPDAQSTNGSLIDPVEAMTITQIFEQHAVR